MRRLRSGPAAPSSPVALASDYEGLTPNVRFRRAIERRARWLAEDAARELANLPLEDAYEWSRLSA